MGFEPQTFTHRLPVVKYLGVPGYSGLAGGRKTSFGDDFAGFHLHPISPMMVAPLLLPAS